MTQIIIFGDYPLKPSKLHVARLGHCSKQLHAICLALEDNRLIF